MKTNRRLFPRLSPKEKQMKLTAAFASNEQGYLFEVKILLQCPHGHGTYEIMPYYDILDLLHGSDRYEMRELPEEITNGIYYQEDLEAILMDYFAPVESQIYPFKVVWGKNISW
jgi:hypothetical protein